MKSLTTILFVLLLAQCAYARENNELADFYKYMTKNISYPAEARRMGIDGGVYVLLTLNEDGTNSEVAILKDIGGGCGREVKRVLKKLPTEIGKLLVDKTSTKTFLLPVGFGFEEPFTPKAMEPPPGAFRLEPVLITAKSVR